MWEDQKLRMMCEGRCVDWAEWKKLEDGVTKEEEREERRIGSEEFGRRESWRRPTEMGKRGR